MKKTIILAAITVLVAGCATGPKTAMNSRVLKASNVVYFEQSDRIPKDVLLAAKKPVLTSGVEAGSQTVPIQLIGEIVKKALEIAPEMSKTYSEERMYNALLGRRMLFIGYDSPEQLKEINSIVESMGKAIENVTPGE